ncbi:MAG: biotin transporter BioY, partial [Bacteroidota bacterium]
LALARPASIDRLRADDAPVALQAAGIVGFAALTALFAQAELRIYLWEVPLTLQTLAVYSSGLFLGRRNGALAMGLYLLAGLALPIYSDGGSGLAHLMGLTGGYLVGFPVAAFLAGALTRQGRSLSRIALGLVAASVALFSCGVMGLVLATDLGLAEAVQNGWLRFIPWDLTKLALVGALYAGARRATAEDAA